MCYDNYYIVWFKQQYKLLINTVPKTLKSKKPVVTTVNTLNSPENKKDCELL